MIGTESEELNHEGRSEACKTYIEQTKLLVTLASAFLIAPAVVIVRTSGQAVLQHRAFWWFVSTEVCFVFSVLMGYFVLGSIAGSQDDGSFDVYRSATRGLSISQLISYLLGLVLFIVLIIKNTTS